MIHPFLQENDEYTIIVFLKNAYLNKNMLSDEDKIKLDEYQSTDYALLGVIGLLLNDNARILLGKKQPFNAEVKKLCDEIPISFSVLADIADKYLEIEHSIVEEFVFRNVMLEYPYEENHMKKFI